ncbi:MAG: hypothetical protein QM820_47290 [Minicystis sp.]
MADQDLGDAEGPRHADADGQHHREERADAEVVEEDDARDEDDAELADVGEVLVDAAVLLVAALEIAAHAPGDAGVVLLDVGLLDDLADAAQGLLAALQLGAHDLRADGDDQGLAVLGLVVAVRVLLLLLLAHAQRLAHRLGVERGRLLVVVEERAGRLVHLVRVAALDVVVDLLELLHVGVEPGARADELDHVVNAVLDAADPGRSDLGDLRDERVAGLAQRLLGRARPALEDDEERRDARRLLRHAVQLDHARPVLRQERLEARLDLELEREEDGEHCDQGRDEQRDRGPVDLEIGQLVGERGADRRRRRRDLAGRRRRRFDARERRGPRDLGGGLGAQGNLGKVDRAFGRPA